MSLTENIKLDRALRLADLVINAAAVPLPVSMTPSALLQQQAAETEITPPPRADAALEHATQAPPVVGPDTNIAAAVDHPVADDAVLKSLHSAVDALHDSLHDTAGTHEPLSLTNLTDGLPVSDLSASNVSLVHPSSESISSADHSFAAVVDHATSGDARTPPLAQTASPELAQPNEPESGILHVAQTTEGIVDNLTETVASTLGHVPTDIGAVTIPSLGGLGFDALAGLLHPAVSPDTTHASDPALTDLHDMPVFAAIGVPEVVHADQELAHATHSLLHLAGSGLI